MADFQETRQKVRELVQGADKITPQEFQKKQQAHADFLQSGGAGGYWETFYIEGMIFGVYRGAGAGEGEQMKVNFRDLSEIDLSNITLPYADLASSKAPNKNWENADLEGSLLIDSILDNCNFEGADLYAADFSRSSMRNANLRGASLIDTDFENCDLTGADLRGASIDETTKFKNAILDDVKRD